MQSSSTTTCPTAIARPVPAIPAACVAGIAVAVQLVAVVALAVLLGPARVAIGVRQALLAPAFGVFAPAVVPDVSVAVDIIFRQVVVVIVCNVYDAIPDRKLSGYLRIPAGAVKNLGVIIESEELRLAFIELGDLGLPVVPVVKSAEVRADETFLGAEARNAQKGW